MKKQYKLLIETADYPKGMIVSEDADYNYDEAMIYQIIGKTIFNKSWFTRWQIENRPTVWELITQEPVEEKVENEYKSFVPSKDEIYFVVDPEGGTDERTNYTIGMGLVHHKQGAFRTEQAAKYEALRRESMSKRWKPEYEEEYFYYHFRASIVDNARWRNDSIDKNNFFIGNVHKTNEECVQWSEKYKEAWEVLL